MNGAHLHIIVNHFPLAGLFFSLVLLITGLALANSGFVKAGLVIAVLAGLLTIPTYLSGESAEDILKQSPTFAKEVVHEHEEAANFAISFMEAIALVSLAGLYMSFKKGKLPNMMVVFIIALQLFTFSVVARTNYLGGKISHPEISQ